MSQGVIVGTPDTGGTVVNGSAGLRDISEGLVGLGLVSGMLGVPSGAELAACSAAGLEVSSAAGVGLAAGATVSIFCSHAASRTTAAKMQIHFFFIRGSSIN